MIRRAVILACLAVSLLESAAWAGDPVAILTAIRKGQGAVKVKFPGDRDWTDADLLMELRENDVVSAAGRAEATVVYLKGASTQAVTAANSPLVVHVPPDAGGSAIANLAASFAEAFVGKKKPPAYVAAGGRGRGLAVDDGSPRIVAPRDSRFLPGPIVFEWTGPDVPYTATVFGPGERVLWTGPVSGRAFTYPSTAPELEPGHRYAWRLGTEGRYRDEDAFFDIVTPDEARRIQGLLAEVDATRGATTPPATVALLRAGLLLREGFADVARRELLAAIERDGGDPTLHHMLGHVYDRLGLRDRATAAFREAQAVSARTP
jgi:hypothetical protein